MKWIDNYRSRVCSAEQAVRAVESGQRVFLTGNAAYPTHIAQALAARADELHNVEVVHLLDFGNTPLSQGDAYKSFRHCPFFLGPSTRRMVNSGQADFIPIFLSEIARLFKTGAMPLDVAVIHTTPPDEHGFLSYGVEVGITKPAAECAKVVIAQVNDHMPRTLGDSFIHMSKVDHIVEISEPIPTMEQRQPTEVEGAIGEHIAERVPHGACLQLGIGGIPNGVLGALGNKRDLGIHTEMFSDGILQLMDAGVVTGERKNRHRGKIVAGFFMGSQELYDTVDNNPLFEFHPSDYTNDPFVIASHDRMVSVNSAIEIDLTGQVCADSIGTRMYSGIGGQVDFVRGASRSKDGMAVIALPATAKDGALSRIVPRLKPGAGVVTSRGDVHFVATEFGVVQLHGHHLRERARRLIEIAHPRFRDELLEQRDYS